MDYETINYFEESLSADALSQLLHRASLRPQDAMRTNEEAYRQHVAGRNLSDEQLIHVMAEHPELIQRPLVVRGEKAVLARPTERLAKLGLKVEQDE